MTAPRAPSVPDRADGTAHISGIVVNAVQAAADAVVERIEALEGAEVVGRNGGRLVVVLEAADEGHLVALVNRISLFEHVYSASMVAHFVDTAEAEGAEP